MNFTRTFLTTALMLPAFSSFAALQLQTYNPGEQGIFPVSSTLISGEKHAILVDAQFGVNDGAKLVEMVKQSGKEAHRYLHQRGRSRLLFWLTTSGGSLSQRSGFSQ